MLLETAFPHGLELWNFEKRTGATISVFTFYICKSDSESVGGVVAWGSSAL